MSTRTRRAAATRRTAVVDSSDEDEISAVSNSTQKIKEESEDDFDPDVTSKTTASRRRTTQSRRTSTIPIRGRGGRRSVAPSEAPENSRIYDEDETETTIIAPATTQIKKETTRKRKSTAPRKSVVEPEPAAVSADEENTVLPTPDTTDGPSGLGARALDDITMTHSVNERRPSTASSTGADDTVATIKPIKAMDTVFEKPMDIMLKSRAMAMPVVEDTGPKARIVITYLILSNFKSYAGRQEVGPFHSSFSSVVGPNGSGKSNVIDALLFVFGFRASKMRQGKISALIHNSAQHPNLDHCEVAVHFQEVMDLVSGVLTGI